VLVIVDVLDELSLLLSQVAHRLVLYLERFGLRDGGVDVSHDLFHLADLFFAVIEIISQLLYRGRCHPSKKTRSKCRQAELRAEKWTKMRLRAVASLKGSYYR